MNSTQLFVFVIGTIITLSICCLYVYFTNRQAPDNKIQTQELETQKKLAYEKGLVKGEQQGYEKGYEAGRSEARDELRQEFVLFLEEQLRILRILKNQLPPPQDITQ